EERKVDGMPLPKLLVRLPPPGDVERNPDLSHDLFSGAHRVDDAVGNEEVRHRDLSPAPRSLDDGERAERHEHRWCIRRMRRDTLLAHLRDMAYVAVLLQAESERPAPELRLVVVRAARIQT